MPYDGMGGWLALTDAEVDIHAVLAEHRQQQAGGRAGQQSHGPGKAPSDQHLRPFAITFGLRLCGDVCALYLELLRGPADDALPGGVELAARAALAALLRHRHSLDALLVRRALGSPAATQEAQVSHVYYHACGLSRKGKTAWSDKPTTIFASLGDTGQLDL